MSCEEELENRITEVQGVDMENPAEPPWREVKRSESITRVRRGPPLA